MARNIEEVVRDGNDYELFKVACSSIGLLPTNKQYGKWKRQEGAAYKAANGIHDPNINVQAGKVENIPPQKG